MAEDIVNQYKQLDSVYKNFDSEIEIQLDSDIWDYYDLDHVMDVIVKFTDDISNNSDLFIVKLSDGSITLDEKNFILKIFVEKDTTKKWTSCRIKFDILLLDKTNKKIIFPGIFYFNLQERITNNV